MNAGGIPTRTGEILDQAGTDRIGDPYEDDRNRAGHLARPRREGTRLDEDDVGLQRDERPNGFSILGKNITTTPHFEPQIAALQEAVPLEMFDDHPAVARDRCLAQTGKQEANSPRSLGAFGLFLARAK